MYNDRKVKCNTAQTTGISTFMSHRLVILHGNAGYKGDHIVLYDSLGFDISDPVQKQEKIDSALSMEALFYLAQKDGMIVSVEEVKSKLESDRLAAENAENYDEFLAMISGMNMTVNEYWSWSRLGDVTQKIMTIDKLMKQQRGILAEEYKNNSEIDIEVKLEEWRLATVKNILDEDNVEKIEH